MNRLSQRQLNLLENKIRKIVKRKIMESTLLEVDGKEEEGGDDDFSKYKEIGTDKFVGDEEASEDYKRQYKEIEKKLTDPTVNPTQIMAKALGFDPDDDSARSHAFKKLYKDKTPSGDRVYKFSPSEVAKIAFELK